MFSQFTARTDHFQKFLSRFTRTVVPKLAVFLHNREQLRHASSYRPTVASTCANSKRASRSSASAARRSRYFCSSPALAPLCFSLSCAVSCCEAADSGAVIGIRAQATLMLQPLHRVELVRALTLAVRAIDSLLWPKQHGRGFSAPWAFPTSSKRCASRASAYLLMRR